MKVVLATGARGWEGKLILANRPNLLVGRKMRSVVITRSKASPKLGNYAEYGKQGGGKG